MPKRSTTRHLDGVLVVGGGYAGVHAARAVQSAGMPCTVVDPTGVHAFTTRLAAVAGGTAPARDAGVPLERLCGSVLRGRVTGVDDGAVTLADQTTLSADAVVIAAGSRTLSVPIDGLDQAHGLRTPHDALALRRATTAATPVVVVGGGPTGVQFAGALSSTRPDLRVALVDAGSSLLDPFHESLGRHARAVLEGRGVDVMLGASLDAVTHDGAVLDDGSVVPGIVVWAGGFSSVVDSLGGDLPIDDGSIRVDPELRVSGWTKTFAVGDVATHRKANGDRHPMCAQVAVGAGDAAGANAVRLLQGRPLAAVDISHLGWVLDLGGWQGVAELGPIRLAAPGLDRIPPLLHSFIDWKDLVEIGGLAGLRNAPGLTLDGEQALRQLAELDLEHVEALARTSHG